LIIPAHDTLHVDVFPSVDCSPRDDEVEVVHLSGVNKCRKRGQTCGKADSDSSDVASDRRSSPESGYRSVANGVSSTPVVLSDVSFDSLSSCPSFTVTSPPLTGPCSHSGGLSTNSDLPIGTHSQPSELQTETRPVITRTAAEDELIRSILEDHCKSLCAHAVADSNLSTCLSVGDSKDSSTKVDSSVSSPSNVSGASLTIDEWSRMEERMEAKSDGTEQQREEYLGDSEKAASVDETVASVARESSPSLVVDDEISIYDSSRLRAPPQPSSTVCETATVETSVVEDELSIYDGIDQQLCSAVSEIAAESSAVEDDISVYDDGRLADRQQLSSTDCAAATAEYIVRLDDLSVCCQQKTGCIELLSPLQFSDTDSVVSDTKMSRTSSALSLDSLAHSAEVR